MLSEGLHIICLIFDVGLLTAHYQSLKSNRSKIIVLEIMEGVLILTQGLPKIMNKVQVSSKRKKILIAVDYDNYAIFLVM